MLCAVYAIVAAVLFWRASRCPGWMCDLRAFPVIVPAGLIVSPALERLDAVFRLPGLTPSTLVRSPWFIGPTVLGNVALYYGMGALAGAGVQRIASFLARRRGR